MKKSILIVFCLVLFGCDSDKNQNLPEVNSENCMVENIALLQGSSAQEAMSSKCSRLSVIEKTDNPTNWLQINPKEESKNEK